MAAYSPERWHDVFVASTGAGAALAGLLFVAVSVNVEPILESDGLADRALQTLILLLGVVIVSIIGLIPGQGNDALGLELLVFGALLTIGVFSLLPKTLPVAREHERAAFHIVLILPGTVPLLAGGISLLAQTGGGLYWVVAAIAGSIAGASANAWVLLVEILR